MISGIALFVGVESQSWTLPQFREAARNAKALGISSLIFKVADGVYEWYGQVLLQTIIETLKDEGLFPIPYTYCYGNKFGALQSEIALLKEIISSVGRVIADMEVEWNSQVSWGNAVSNALKDAPGIFGVTTWADPQLQSWQGVIQALKPCVDVWLPQVYSDYLASVYKEQFAGLTVVPVLNLDESFGPNDPLQHAKNAQTPAIALWEYQAATGGYAQVVKEIMAMSSVPKGWSDDGTTLRSPDGVPVVLGFRQFVLSNDWDPDDWSLRPEYGADPVEKSNPSLGSGTAQEFRMTRLCWTPERGVYKSWIGQELKWYQDNQK